MRATTRKTTKPTKPVVRTLFRVLVDVLGPVGNVVEMDPTHPDTKAREARGEIRPATQAERGPAVPFFQTFNRTEMTWHPETEGSYLVVFKAGCDGQMADGRRLQLAFGSVGVPCKFLEAAVADLVLAEAMYPDVAGRLTIVKAPCVYCRAEDHRAVEWAATAEMRADAATVAAKDFCRHLSLDPYKRKYRIPSFFC